MLEEMLSVKPLKYDCLGEEGKQYFRDLSSYNPSWLREKLQMEEFPMECYDEAFTELKKYVSLNRIYNKPLAMTSKIVDEVWHQLILFTREYHEFSERFIGHYFHHAPNLPSNAQSCEGYHNFVDLYQKTYGAVPEIWKD